MKKTIIRPLFFCAALLWLAALAAATRFDLAISLAIADESSVFGRILEVAGEPPAILFSAFNLALMHAYFCKHPDRPRKSRSLGALCFVGCVGCALFACIKTVNYLLDWQLLRGVLPVLFAIFTALLIAAGFLYAAGRLSAASLEKYFDTACRCVYAAIAALIIIWAFKLFWGRVRFRQLDGDLSRFTPWYLPQGINGYFSFPSGHTANAAVIFTSVYYLRFLPKKFARCKPLLVVLLLVWIVVAAYSRVRVGAHYLSDVLFGAAITFGIAAFFNPKNHDQH